MEAILLFILFLISEILGTIAGFGSSAFFVSLGQFVFGLHTVLALTAIQHVFGNVMKMILFRHDIDWSIISKIAVVSIIYSVIGSGIGAYMDDRILNLCLAFFLIIMSLLFIKNKSLTLTPNTKNLVLGGSFAGFLAGLIGTGGAIRGMLLYAMQFPKNTFVATSATIDLGVDASRAIVYLKNGYLDASNYYLVWYLLAIAIAGSSLGKIILDKIPQEHFQNIVLGLMLLTGVILFIKILFT